MKAKTRFALVFVAVLTGILLFVPLQSAGLWQRYLVIFGLWFLLIIATFFLVRTPKSNGR